MDDKRNAWVEIEAKHESAPILHTREREERGRHAWRWPGQHERLGPVRERNRREPVGERARSVMFHFSQILPLAAARGQAVVGCAPRLGAALAAPKLLAVRFPGDDACDVNVAVALVLVPVPVEADGLAFVDELAGPGRKEGIAFAADHQDMLVPGAAVATAAGRARFALQVDTVMLDFGSFDSQAFSFRISEITMHHA